MIKKTTAKRLSVSFGLALLAMVLTSVSTPAQNARRPLPMRIYTSEGVYELTVPDTQTTQSAYGSKLRRYDVHIAKMFEVTYRDCLEFGGDAGGRGWYYYAGNGSIAIP